MSAVPAPLDRVLAALRREWGRWRGKLTAPFLVLALWRPIALVVPALVYGIPAFRALTRRLLYSVRAKLAAFYVFAGVLPVVLLIIVLMFAGYVTLGQTSARLVEQRLEQHVEWAESCTYAAERAYWSSRSTGASVTEAAGAALAAGWGRAPASVRCWARAGDDLIAAIGTPGPHDFRVPPWLGERTFVGLTAVDSTQMALRTRVRLLDSGTILEIGAVMPIDDGWLNRSLSGTQDVVRGGVGRADRTLFEFTTTPDSVIVQEGVLALFNPSGTFGGKRARFSIGDDRARPAATDSIGLRWRVTDDPVVVANPDSPFREYPSLAPWNLRSRWSLQRWLYIANPVDWETGSTDGFGPPITILFTVEGATKALTRFGVGDIENIVLILVIVVVGVLSLIQIVATLQGFVYARAIANSVATLDRGVRGIRAGDFSQRIVPRERDQLGALATGFNSMSERLQGLLEERVHHEAMEREIAIARDVQTRLFPARAPYAPFLEAVGVCVPARVVSGDAYDFVEVPGGWDMIIADVSGKGMSAALLMASTHSALHAAYLGLPRGAALDPAEIVTRLNHHLHQYAEPTRFVTLFMARYCGDGKLIYCNAGHNPGVLLRDGRAEWLASGGLMLGPFPDLVYQSATIDVRPGDVVCLYTDGLTEAESPSGEQFGEERLVQSLRQVADKSPQDIVTALQADVREWHAGAELGDDLTLVVLRIVA